MSRVSELPENKGKDLRDIDWAKHEEAIGVRLCTESIDYTQYHELQDIKTTAEVNLTATGTFYYRFMIILAQQR